MRFFLSFIIRFEVYFFYVFVIILYEIVSRCYLKVVFDMLLVFNRKRMIDKEILGVYVIGIIYDELVIVVFIKL